MNVRQLKMTLLMLMVSITGLAQQKTTKIEGEQYRCESVDQKRQIAIKMKTRTEAAKIWEVDINSRNKDIGFEYPVTEFQTARCPGCFSFKANYELIELNGKMNNFEFTLEASVAGGRSEVIMDKVTCKIAKD